MWHNQVPQPEMGDAVFDYRYYENTTSRHAFWACWVERDGKKWYFCWRFGKIGSYGRFGHKGYHNSASALAAMEDKAYDKTSGDYLLTFKGGASCVQTAGATTFPKTPFKPWAFQAGPKHTPLPPPPPKPLPPLPQADATVEDVLDLLLEL